MNMIATRKFSAGMIALALCAIVIGAAVVPQAALATGTVRISQVYGGGGATSAGPTYSTDYVELFNNSNLPVTVPAPGWTLQYGSATGTSFGSTATNIAPIPAGTVIPACGYLLIACGTVGTGASLPVGIDIDNSSNAVGAAAGPNISASTGKIALISKMFSPNGCTAGDPTSLGNTIGGNPSIIDAIGWGPTANCFETAVAGVLTNTKANVRNGGGTQDTDSNAADFTAVTAPVPRNSLTAANATCTSGTLWIPNTWGRLKTIYR